MTDENTSGERRSLSLAEAAEALKQSRVPKEEPKPEEVEVPEEVEDQAETEAEDEAELEPTEVDDDQSEEEGEDESEPDSDDELYEVGDVQFTAQELREWKANGLRQSDYTKKTQELSEQRKAFDDERGRFQSEKQQEVERLKAEKAQLQDQLATFAIEQDPEPSPDGLTWEDYTKRKTAWDKRQTKRNEARQAYQALKHEEHMERVTRETQQALQYFPDWQKPGAYEQAVSDMTKAAEPFGFSKDEVIGIDDHRIFRVLDRLVKLEAADQGRKAASESAQKKAAKAVKRLSPGAKPNAKNQESKELRQSRERLRKTGSVNDAVAALRAKRRTQA